VILKIKQFNLIKK